MKRLVKKNKRPDHVVLSRAQLGMEFDGLVGKLSGDTITIVGLLEVKANPELKGDAATQIFARVAALQAAEKTGQKLVHNGKEYTVKLDATYRLFVSTKQMAPAGDARVRERLGLEAAFKKRIDRKNLNLPPDKKLPTLEYLALPGSYPETAAKAQALAEDVVRLIDPTAVKKPQEAPPVTRALERAPPEQLLELTQQLERVIVSLGENIDFVEKMKNIADAVKKEEKGVKACST